MGPEVEGELQVRRPVPARRLRGRRADHRHREEGRLGVAWPRRVGELRVEPARPRDALAILGIHRDVLEEGTWFATRPEELTLTLEEQERRIRAAAESDRACLLVARAPSRPVVGWLALNGGALARTRHTARLEVMVARAHRRQGVGEALVRAGLAWAEDHPFIAKIGLAVYAHNERAIALYHKLGFEEEGRRIAEYHLEDGSWRDDVLMFTWVKPR